MARKIHVRPGKTQSKVGFAVGIIFCIIGVVMVIPIFGPFGIFWTIIAGFITYTNYRNGFTDKGIDSQVIEIDEDGQDITVTSRSGFQKHYYGTQSSSSQESVEERLRKLQNLYDQSLITAEEYDRKRKEILEDL